MLGCSHVQEAHGGAVDGMVNKKTLALVRTRRVEKQQVVILLSDIDLLCLSHNSFHFSE
jgi:hypothetical protein